MTFNSEIDSLVLGRAARRLREMRGLSIDEAAALVGREAAILNAIEQGEMDPRWSTIMALLRSYDATLPDLASEMD
ncbi:MAG TPA: helix-turn-helix transcriptional regulator [Solirubrobacteraceae bacterium]|nr:helix-turn-helix transcriptional regulator [Solirubrobacteraceae bacterium]